MKLFNAQSKKTVKRAVDLRCKVLGADFLKEVAGGIGLTFIDRPPLPTPIKDEKKQA